MVFITVISCCDSVHIQMICACLYMNKRASALCPGCSAYGGYVVGLGTTIVVMNVFEAAQPALLYIVPAVLGAVLSHAALNKEFLEVC